MDNTKAPQLILGASVDGQISTPNFFSEENNKFFDLMKDPPYLRYSGWNMLTLDYPQIKNGEWWEVNNGDRKTVRLYEDGTLVASAYADNSFLGWGKSDEEFLQSPSLRSLAVIEYLYEFVNVYLAFLERSSFSRGTITFKMDLVNTELSSGKKLKIGTSQVLALFPETSNEIASDKKGEIVISNDNLFQAEYIAYKVVALLYRWFNVPENKIPYIATDKEGNHYIDTTSFPK